MAVGIGSLAIVPCFVTYAGEGCSDTSGPIEVDRPDVTNSSSVVPTGSVQVENGINWTDQRVARTFDGTNTRVRASVGGCSEVLVDLPDYQRRLNGDAATGFTAISPAVKHQFAPLPGEVQWSGTVGVALPTAAAGVADRGSIPYLQFPWSHEISQDWSLSGMLTTFWSPAVPRQHVRVEPTLSLGREFGPNRDLFVEYVGEYFDRGGSAQAINTGGALRITRLQQLDFHLQFGLNEPAPRYLFGIGYSIRWDQLY